MKQARRKFLASSVAGGAALVAMGALRPIGAYAAQPDSSVAANHLADALKSLGVNSMIESKDIQIKAPEIAQDGAVVPVEVLSALPGTQAISFLIEKNPSPLAASFLIPSGTDSYVKTRLKISESSPLHVVVKVRDKFYHAVKDVKVTLGGCGGAPQIEKEKNHG